LILVLLFFFFFFLRSYFFDIILFLLPFVNIFTIFFFLALLILLAILRHLILPDWGKDCWLWRKCWRGRTRRPGNETVSVIFLLFVVVVLSSF